jgi:hypothetical protein
MAMNSTMLDRFLEKLARSPELQRELVELAARHGIDFSAGELGEDELDKVAGGTLPIPLPTPQSLQLQLSNISRLLHDTARSIIGNMR